MQYFIPDWEDRIDPNFNFDSDFKWIRNSDSYTGRVYAHEIFKKPPYDGILISLGLLNKFRPSNNDAQPSIRGFTDIKQYLRINSNNPLKVMGDCGAFSYVNQDIVPFSVTQVADLYDSLNFDLGISLDHLVVKSIVNENGKKIDLSESQQETRRQLSLENAKAFLNYCRAKRYSFVPIGAAQGLSTRTYIDSVDKLIEMNYNYIALGGLIRYTTAQVDEIVTAIMEDVVSRKHPPIKVHLLGVLRPQLLRKFRRFGITSFDSASYLRKAWLRSSMNYFGPDEKWYSAIRVPYSWNSNIRASAKEHGISLDKLQRLERDAMTALKGFAKSNEDLVSALDAVLEYDTLLFRASEKTDLKERYKQTLQSRIWERCSCEICTDAGIDVLIFRGANRNKRRGFHNVKIFHNLILNQN
ncbi:MAG: tRNA-guanine transglycosylase DpdA [Candidatus Poribacteria bacterium]|nr:tRNA-guanine transglycosylase DpdA [Candidatus Poribacteria bacterium]